MCTIFIVKDESHISNKSLVFRTYKDYLHLNIKVQTQFKNEQKTWTDIFLKMYKWQTGTQKDTQHH